MTPKKYHKTMLGLAVAGTLFSGYLSGTKLFTKGCAFNEPCPYFLGYPACYFGFVMFFAMLCVAIWAVAKKVTDPRPAQAILIISLMGTLFAGYYTLGEVAAFFGGTTPDYTLVLPTCSYGLVFYVLMLVISALQLRKKGSAPPEHKAEMPPSQP